MSGHVSAWGRLAEVVKEYIGKGKRVRLFGYLEEQTWDDHCCRATHPGNDRRQEGAVSRLRPRTHRLVEGPEAEELVSEKAA
jgi:single-stranded DNA-binding protein